MTTNTPPTDLKDYPEVHHIGLPEHGHLPPGPGKPKRRGIVWVLFLVIIAGITGYAVWKAGQKGTFQQSNQQGNGRGRGRGARGGGGGLGPIPVVTAKVSRADLPVYLNGLGNVAAFYTVTVKSRVDGQLMKVNFNEGDLVKEGQVLMEIDPRPYQVQLDQAEGTMAHDQALLDDAKLDLDRYKALLEQDAIPKQQLDTQKALVAQYEGSLKQDLANVNSAKLNLTYSKVTAPITGNVGLRLVDPGNIVHASDANGMVVITQLQPIQVQFTIPEDSLPAVLKKMRAGVQLPVDAFSRDNGTKLATGEFKTVDNQIDNTTGTAKLKAVFKNEDYTLFPNQFVNIRLKVDTLTQRLVVPVVAIQNGQQGTFVYTVDPETSKVHLKTVKVGVTDENNAEITSGITEQDQVVIDGTDRLDEGTEVRVRAPGELEKLNAPSGRGRRRGGRGGGGNPNGASANGQAPQGAAAPQSGYQPGIGNNPGGSRDFKGRGDFKGKKGAGAPQ
ncbi:MAG TPA: MdtA/MuxA family multidrug efflux RND transporter periplasmic adaptor subunit [Bryobacteraceae bacterium]|jgi:multidrug efflux system membrane fusion protein|nr:MdtA/MuxA family multidrug efflux RND transporter periplasmic adaptor subunit [Bryobacteraceae bacterium]